jgi:hypothetical protein
MAAWATNAALAVMGDLGLHEIPMIGARRALSATRYDLIFPASRRRATCRRTIPRCTDPAGSR